MSQPWTNAPILWAATDEVVPADGHRDPSQIALRGNRQDENYVGGGVSGRW